MTEYRLWVKGRQSLKSFYADMEEMLKSQKAFSEVTVSLMKLSWLVRSRYGEKLNRLLGLHNK